MDVLTDLLNEMYLSGEVVARFDLKAPWGITMPPHGGIFHAVDQGDCWVRLAPDGELLPVSAGDLIIFPEGRLTTSWTLPLPWPCPSRRLCVTGGSTIWFALWGTLEAVA